LTAKEFLWYASFQGMVGRKNFTVKAMRLNKNFVSGEKVVVATVVVAVHRIFTVGIKR